MDHITNAEKVKEALWRKNPLVALESAVISHGLPSPHNIEVALAMEELVEEAGAVPATIGIIDGEVKVGLSEDEIRTLAGGEGVQKVGPRHFSSVLTAGDSGGTTVGGTLTALKQTDIMVLATGGIGGVHRGNPHDVSADIPILANIRAIVVCSGAKSILDIPATLEMLETHAVPVIGYQCDHFPAFYATSSGLPVQTRVEEVDEVVEMARKHWMMGLESALLLVVPPPKEDAVDHEEMEEIISRALEEADEEDISGPGVTPYLLDRVQELTDGKSLQANLSLLRNNALIAAEVAKAYSDKKLWDIGFGGS